MSLPEEILTEIFRYVPAADRKNIRLVNKQWYDACNFKPFLIQEKLVCYGVYDTIVIVDTLMKCKRTYHNLEFQNVEFKENTIPFWETCGNKIYSLNFIDCIFTPGIMKTIITCCENLLCYSLKFYRLYDIDILYLNDEFFELMENNIVRRSLLVFNMKILDSKWISNFILYGIFNVFPAVKHLEFCCNSIDPSSHSCDADQINLLSKTKFSVVGILNKITSLVDVLETVKLNFKFSEFPEVLSEDVFKSVAKLTKLENLAVVNMNTVPPAISLLSQFKHLKFAEFFMASISVQFLIHLLSECALLCYLKILSFNDEICINSELFEKLVKSHLETFYIDDTVIILDEDITIQKDLPINHTLKYLRIYYDDLQSDVQILFVRYFRNLQHLEFHNVANDALQSIIKYEKNLKSFILYDCEYTNDFGFTGLSFDGRTESDVDAQSIRQLDKLEYLNVRACLEEWRVSKFVFSEFIFPKLKYLYVRPKFESESIFTALFTSIQKLPELEALHLYCEWKTTYNMWLQLCQKLTKLQYLCILGESEEEKFSDLEYKNIFKACPSLHVLVHQTRDSHRTPYSYYYDSAANRIIQKTGDYKYHITTKKVGTSFIDWMTF